MSAVMDHEGTSDRRRNPDVGEEIIATERGSLSTVLGSGTQRGRALQLKGTADALDSDEGTQQLSPLHSLQHDWRK
eukprot:CAMPEP_0184498560 /NCGR_PEP_ID=MMETSP0113_2-20130426/39324_1 /TAXON_ID=91329 /ORGANISM="Norrisiella sphaerica, Strain BC52" /LENGTH=75 /DNA_ID=CAMNT_0026886139 /DNA_START=65 /DNA_END=289 /DNA_ORIENTATION=+